MLLFASPPASVKCSLGNFALIGKAQRTKQAHTTAVMYLPAKLPAQDKPQIQNIPHTPVAMYLQIKLYAHASVILYVPVLPTHR